MEIEVKDIREFDVFVSREGQAVWTALTNARPLPSGGIAVDVEYTDNGGVETRGWGNPTRTILIRRPKEMTEGEK